MKIRSVPFNHPDRQRILARTRELHLQIFPLTPIQLAHCAVTQGCKVSELCVMCGIKIETMSFKGTGVCSELCRKDRENDHSKSHAIIEAPAGGERAV